MAFTNKLQPIVYPYHFSKKDFTKEMCSGRTTAWVLLAIGTSMGSPHVPIDLVHFREQDSGRNNITFCEMKMSGGFLDAVEDAINKLGLKFLKLDRNNLTLTYEIY